MPLIVCDIEKLPAIIAFNFLLNPLGTFIASAVDSRGFNFRVFVIATLQLMIWILLSYVPYFSRVLGHPNWLYGIFIIGARNAFYNVYRFKYADGSI